MLYRVKATYGYVKEDVDELSFEIGDTIRVIEYDDPEDQVKLFSLPHAEIVVSYIHIDLNPHSKVKACASCPSECYDWEFHYLFLLNAVFYCQFTGGGLANGSKRGHKREGPVSGQFYASHLKSRCSDDDGINATPK